ncbi:hypothetical protein G7046_g1289 [Stylonectria norvegica]|nr:hypothetical protein G7046_g1289 [Stylonectria norvegica]
MRSFAVASVFAGFVASVSSVGVLLPLYVYPAAVWTDVGAPLWKPVVDAVAAHTAVPWLVVVNAHNGPGLTYQPGDKDDHVIAGVTELNKHANVKTIGYVRTNYATSSMDELKLNITTWKNWSTYTASDISVKGIFFDESSDNFDYFNEAITFARSTFVTPITIICNFGAKADAKYYAICDVVVAFESHLNAADAPQYKSQTTITANIPSGYEEQAAILVNQFTGTSWDGKTANADLIESYIDTISDNNVGWAYFTSVSDYNTINVAPATIAEVAQAVSDS